MPRQCGCSLFRALEGCLKEEAFYFSCCLPISINTYTCSRQPTKWSAAEIGGNGPCSNLPDIHLGLCTRMLASYMFVLYIHVLCNSPQHRIPRDLYENGYQPCYNYNPKNSRPENTQISIICTYEWRHLTKSGYFHRSNPSWFFDKARRFLLPLLTFGAFLFFLSVLIGTHTRTWTMHASLLLTSSHLEGQKSISVHVVKCEEICGRWRSKSFGWKFAKERGQLMHSQRQPNGTRSCDEIWNAQQECRQEIKSKTKVPDVGVVVIAATVATNTAHNDGNTFLSVLFSGWKNGERRTHTHTPCFSLLFAIESNAFLKAVKEWV